MVPWLAIRVTPAPRLIGLGLPLHTSSTVRAGLDVCAVRQSNGDAQGYTEASELPARLTRYDHLTSRLFPVLVCDRLNTH